MKVEGLVVIITGGASGIGKAVTERLLEKGAKHVAILDHSENVGKKTENEFQAKFGTQRVQWLKCDVTSEKQLKAIFLGVHAQYNQLDVVINNAGKIQETVDDVIALFLTAVIKGTYLGRTLMSNTRGGSGGLVINTASCLGLVPGPFFNYSAAKFGVVGFSRSIGEFDPEFSIDNVRIATICPWYVATNIARRDLPDLPCIEEHDRERIYVDMPRVVDAFIMAIEDDMIHGNAGVVRVLPESTTIEEFPSRQQIRETWKI